MSRAPGSPRPFRVLTLSTLFPDATRPNFGIFVERQTRELASRPNLSVTVIAPIGLPPPPLSRRAPYAARAALPREEIWRGLTVHRPRFLAPPLLGTAINPLLLARAVLPLARRLHAEAPFDVIDAEFFYPDGPAARHIARALGLPYSIKARGADIHHFGRTAGARWQILRAGRQAGGLLAVSAAMREDMAVLGLPRDRIHVHYTGVDLGRFSHDRAAEKAKLGLSGPIILSVGALIPRKGQALVIEALRDIPEATLLLAGEGPERATYQALANRLGVSERVRFLGAVPHDALPPLLAAADIMALPSRSEGLANAWVEALAAGTPIVISDVGGARELLKDESAGRIVARTPAAIAAAVAALLDAPPAPEAVRAAARPFTWAANAERLEEHLRAIADQA